MRRRDALRWVGAGLVGLTGCLGDGSGDDGSAWRLPASIREDLAAAASFRVHGAGMTTLGATDAPLVTTDRTSEADLGESSPVFELTVENAGDRDGTFRGVTALSNDRDGPIRFPVPAGETVTRAVTNSLVESWRSGATLRESPSPPPRTRKFRFDGG